ncbi:hypothetical protein JYT61_00170 [bacterium AH-315-E10]|nr:hypothetical protein [bacterium AH-315-E10]
MTLLFTGTYSIWLTLILFTAASGLTIFLYRKSNINRPWSIYLGTLRIVAFFLLFLTLFQPVIAKYFTETIRGHIPVIIDNSGSMSIKDDYSLTQKLDVAWQYELFPQDLRSVAAKEQLEIFEDNIKVVLANQNTSKENKDEIVGNTTPFEKMKLSFDTMAKQLDELEDVVERCQSKLKSDGNSFGYIKKKIKNAKAATKKRGVFYERFLNKKGTVLKDLTSLSKHLPDKSDASQICASLTVPVNKADHYMSRMQCILTIPKAGKYRFYLKGDDMALLYLSVSGRIEDKRLIASMPQKSSDFETSPSQKSQPMQLEQGQLCYVEVFHLERTGTDNCTVGWSRDDNIKIESPIPGIHLMPYENQAGGGGFGQLHMLLSSNNSELLEHIKKIQKILKQLQKEEKLAGRRQKAGQLVAQFKAVLDSWRISVIYLQYYQSQADHLLMTEKNELVEAAMKKMDEMTRADLAVLTLMSGKSALLNQLADLGEVDVYPLTEPLVKLNTMNLKSLKSTLSSTRLASVTNQIISSYESTPVAAVILLSDGNNNSGKPMAELKKIMDEQQIPLISIGIGSLTPLSPWVATISFPYPGPIIQMHPYHPR